MLWTQDELKELPDNEYNQRITDFQYESGIVTIKLTYSGVETEFRLNSPPGKQIGFLFVQKQRLLIAVQHSSYCGVYVCGETQDKQQTLKQLPLSVNKVLFRFSDARNIDNFGELYLGVQDQEQFSIMDQQRTYLTLQNQLVDFQVSNQQIIYTTPTSVGLISQGKTQQQLQLPLPKMASCCFVCKDCFLFLNKEKIALLIAQGERFVSYEESALKFAARSVRFVDSQVELFGHETFQLKSNLSTLAQVFRLLKDGSENTVQISELLQSLQECKCDGSVFAPLIHYRRDRDQLLQQLLKQFRYNERLLLFAIDFQQDRECLDQLYHVFSHMEPQRKFQLFQKLLSKMDRQPLLDNFVNLVQIQNYEQLNHVFVNFLLQQTLRQNPPMFIILAKTLGAKDPLIVQVIDLYKQQLLGELPEKAVFVYAKQSLQLFQSQKLKIAFSTPQERFASLLQTILQIYQLNPLSGQKFDPKDDPKQRFVQLKVPNDYQLPPNQYQHLKQLVFGEKEKNYAVSENRLIATLPIYTEKTELVQEAEAPVAATNFLSNEAKVLKVGDATDDWDDDQAKKQKKAKKVVIKSAKLGESRPDTWGQQWGSGIVPKAGEPQSLMVSQVVGEETTKIQIQIPSDKPSTQEEEKQEQKLEQKIQVQIAEPLPLQSNLEEGIVAIDKQAEQEQDKYDDLEQFDKQFIEKEIPQAKLESELKGEHNVEDVKEEQKEAWGEDW